MDNAVIPRVEMPVKSVAESSKRGPNSVVENTDWKDFSGKTENTPLIWASSPVFLNVDQNRNDETRSSKNFVGATFRH